MKRIKALTRRMIYIFLSFAVVFPASLVAIGNSGSAMAVTSLPYIETLKEAGGTYNILEIIPTAGEGSIGYYIDGQEPCSNWAQTASKLLGKTTRKDYVDTLFSELSSSGLMGSGSASAPLTAGEAYDEKYPWEPHEGYAQMSLATADEITLNGTFTETLNKDGTFKLTSEFIFVPDGSGGFKQNIEYFTTNPYEQLGDLYFYNPVFAETTESDVQKGTAVYFRNADGTYVYAGTVGTSGFPGMEIGETYYSVVSTGAPVKNADATHIYAAVSSTYVSAASGEGYFNAEDIAYEYVGTGGTHVYNPQDGGAENLVKCRTVFYKGGFTNNDWFLKYVLDWDGTGTSKPDIAIKVKSLAASSVTSADVNSASLIVVSQGYRPGGGAGQYNSGSDINAEVKTAIIRAVEKNGEDDKNLNLPVVIAAGLSECNAKNVRELAVSLKGTHRWDSYADGSVYFFNGTALATGNFGKAFSQGQYVQENSPFYPVYNEILYENFLRTQEDPDTADKLPENVSMATAIRYIINFGGQRNIQLKTSITVLEIQPGTGSEINPDTVRGWLGIENEADMEVRIVTMSTAEFIGKIEDLVETYDMIYIGSSVRGFNTKRSGSQMITDYNDNAMDGLLYSNIGDSYVGGYLLSGMLDRDFASGNTFYNNGTYYNKINAADQTRTFRFSGNDLSDSKVSELENFSKAGYPIIVSDELTAGGAGNVVFSALVTAQVSGTSVTLTASANAIEGSLPSGAASYQWYENSRPVNGATDSYYKFDPAQNSSGDYYCEITISGQTAVSNTIRVSRSEGAKGSYKLANPSTAESGSYYTYGPQNFRVDLSSDETGWVARNTPVTLTARVSGSLPAGASYSYQWYRKGVAYGGTVTTGSTSNTTTFTTDASGSMSGAYTCEVKVNGFSGTAARSNSVEYTRTSSWLQYITVNEGGTAGEFYQMKTYSFSTHAEPYYYEDTVIIYVDPEDTSDDHNDYSYQWYKNGDKITEYGGSEQYYYPHYPADGEDTYYCEITRNGYTNYRPARSNDIIITGPSAGITQENMGGGENATIISKGYAVNTLRVDYASKMYSALELIMPSPNTMTVSDAEKDSTTVLKYLNLSKPQIVWQTDGSGSDEGSYPTEYAMDDAGNITSMVPGPDGKYYLTYKFTIENDTDATPQSTTYDFRLYTGGLNKEGEQVTGIIVRETETNALILPGSDGKYALKANRGYTVTREMPEGFVGIIPWEIDVYKNGVSEYVHASQHNYTHIKGATETIYVLQIMSKNGTGMNLSTDATYSRLLKQVKDFNVKIETINAYGLDSFSGREVTRIDNGRSVTKTCRTLEEYFASFDMIILGFEDSYREISKAAAEMIVDYSKTGSVLFTHDTTSIVNLPFNHYTMTNGGTVDQPDLYFWGYDFNTILRSVVSLDRYGVTDETWGRTTKYLADSETGNPVVAGPLSETNAALLKNDGYSVAYKPVSTATPSLEIIGEVQGYTKFIPVRYTSNGSQLSPTSEGSYNKSSSNNTTKIVSQVNEGQITTYPFNLNTEGFGNAQAGAGKTISVAETHEQYYQLNMNSDDIVVWYCLDGDPFNAMPNDVVNSYYIYSVGNIIYSGAGHSGSTVTEQEAKLFINTMIAAHKVSRVDPEVSFTDESGKNEMTDYLIPADDEGLLTAGNAKNIYFTVTDTNFGRDKTIRAEFGYKAADGTGILYYLPIYSPQSGDRLNLTEDYTLISGLTYYIKLSELITALNKKGISLDNNEIELQVEVKTIIGDIANTSKPATVSLRRLLLFSLY